jgi:hypothetical protein
MAIVRELRLIHLEKDSKHTEASASYSIVREKDGTKLLQIDSYGSTDREVPGKKSQSIRFSTSAIRQLRRILKEEFPPD